MTNPPHKGAILKQAREAKGVSLRTVHEATKIPLDALKAIEEGYTIRNLSSFYLKGFMKMYASYLGVDVKSVVEDFQPEKLPEPLKPPQVDLERAKIGRFLTGERLQWIIKGLTILVCLFALLKIGGCLVQKIKSSRRAAPSAKTETRKESQSAKKEKAEAAAQAKKDKAKTREAARGAAKESPAKTSAAEEKTSKKISLAVRAKKNSWLLVKVDGSIVFQSTLKKGIVETWTANDTIELAGKSIHDLEFELNGKMIGSLGRQERSARKVIFTQDGFTTK